MKRSLVFSFVFVAVAAFALLSAPQASARALGGFSIDVTGPVTPTPWDPWGGVQLCTYHLRRPLGSGWEYHLASGYDATTCYNNANPYLLAGYTHNPNPGFAPCQCHSGYNGMIVSGPRDNGPVTMSDLTQEQVRAYEDGMAKLRDKYQINKFENEYVQLLQAIESMSADR